MHLMQTHGHMDAKTIQIANLVNFIANRQINAKIVHQTVAHAFHHKTAQLVNRALFLINIINHVYHLARLATIMISSIINASLKLNLIQPHANRTSFLIKKQINVNNALLDAILV